MILYSREMQILSLSSRWNVGFLWCVYWFLFIANCRFRTNCWFPKDDNTCNYTFVSLKLRSLSHRVRVFKASVSTLDVTWEDDRICLSVRDLNKSEYFEDVFRMLYLNMRKKLWKPFRIQPSFPQILNMFLQITNLTRLLLLTYTCLFKIVFQIAYV